jgi:hypothetical protein
VEFGDKAQVVDNADGVILYHSVEIGNPADAPQLAPGLTFRQNFVARSDSVKPSRA